MIASKWPMVWMSPTSTTDACNTIYYFLSVFSRHFNQEDPPARLKRERRQYCSSHLNHKSRMPYDSCRTCASWHCSLWSVHGQGALTVGLLRDCSFFLHRERKEEHLFSRLERRETLLDRWSRRNVRITCRAVGQHHQLRFDPLHEIHGFLQRPR